MDSGFGFPSVEITVQKCNQSRCAGPVHRSTLNTCILWVEQRIAVLKRTARLIDRVAIKRGFKIDRSSNLMKIASLFSYRIVYPPYTDLYNGTYAPFYLQMLSLPAPYESRCIHNSRQYYIPGYDKYSSLSCHLYCISTYIIDKCGCTAHYLPGRTTVENITFSKSPLLVANFAGREYFSIIFPALTLEVGNANPSLQRKSWETVEQPNPPSPTLPPPPPPPHLSVKGDLFLR